MLQIFTMMKVRFFWGKFATKLQKCRLTKWVSQLIGLIGFKKSGNE